MLELAAALKRENPARTAAQVVRVLRASGGWSPSERTLQRHFVRLELTTRPDGSPPPAFGRFEAARPNEMWTGDALHGPVIDGRKKYLFAFIDDHSRLITGHRCRPVPGTTGVAPVHGDADVVSAARVADARDRARRRLRDTPWQANSDVPAAYPRRSWPPTAEALAPVSRAVDLGEISARAAHQVIRVAWTLADLASADRPCPDECGQALAFHLGVAQ